MKRFMLFFVLLVGMLFALPVTGPAEMTNAAKAQQVEICGNGVRLRYGPGLGYGIHCKLNKGKRLSYRYTDGDWYCVRYNGYDLFVSRDFAALRNSTSSAPRYSRSYNYVRVHATNLRVRTGPSTSYPYLVWTATGQTIHLNHGDVLPYLGEKRNGFYKVSFDNRVCWIASKYASLF